MRRYLLVIISFLFIMICAGCEKTGADSSAPASVADHTETEISVPEGLEIVEDMEEFTPVTDDQAFAFETDHQFYLTSNQSFAESGSSYYYLQDRMYLYVFDKETQSLNILCDKPDCNHEYNPEEEISCNAILPGAEGLVYYKDSLYTLMREYTEDGRAEVLCLYKISLDGTERSRVCELAKCYYSENKMEINDEGFSIWYIQHRGYLYYIYNFGTYGQSETFYNNGSHVLYRIPMDGSSEPECITLLQQDGEAAMMNIKGIGSYIYFIQPDYAGIGDLYRLNTESMKIEKIPVTNIASEDYILLENSVIYKKEYDGEVFYQYDISTGSENIYINIDSEDNCQVLYPEYDGKNLYIRIVLADSDYTLWKCKVIDENKQAAAQFQNYQNENDKREFLSSLGGNTDFYFFLDVRGNIYYVDKSKLDGAELNQLIYER